MLFTSQRDFVADNAILFFVNRQSRGKIVLNRGEIAQTCEEQG